MMKQFFVQDSQLKCLFNYININYSIIHTKCKCKSFTWYYTVIFTHKPCWCTEGGVI